MHTARQHTRLAVLVNTASCLLIAACLAVLLVFVLLGQYAQPSSDDFCMASGVSQQGLLTQLWNHYLEWSGRYSSNALYAIYPLILGLFDGYRFIPALVIAALFLATAFLLSTLFRTGLFVRPVLLASAGFVCVYLLGLMSPASSLYWMAGAFTYQTANVLFLVALALMVRLADRQNSGEQYLSLLVVLIVVVVIAIGANETSMLVITALAVTGVVSRLGSARQTLLPWLLVLVVSLLCFAIVYYSPGNTIRAADFPLRHDLLRSIQGSFSVGTKILWIWISDPVLLVSSALAPFAVSALFQASARQSPSAVDVLSGPHIALLALCTFTLPVVLQFPAWWSMGGWPPARTVDAIYFLFLVCWFLTISAITQRYLVDAWTRSYPQLTAVAVLILSVLFTAVALENKTFKLAKTDLFNLARPYHEYLNERYGQIHRALADGQHRLVVADYKHELPRSIFFNDIMQNPGHWRNSCYADYFGLEQISRQHDNSTRSGHDCIPVIAQLCENF